MRWSLFDVTKAYPSVRALTQGSIPDGMDNGGASTASLGGCALYRRPSRTVFRDCNGVDPLMLVGATRIGTVHVGPLGAMLDRACSYFQPDTKGVSVEEIVRERG